jgi:hypothetical protein
MKRKKMRNRLGKKVLSGSMTVDDARRKLGRNVSQKSAGAALAKAQAANAGLSAAAIREAVFAGFRAARPVTEQDVLNAARPMTRPAVTKAAVPVRREHPLQVLKALNSWQPAEAAGPVRPAVPWTPAQLAMLREADKISDPETREGVRASLYTAREKRET